jgi:hypothetical protein
LVDQTDEKVTISIAAQKGKRQDIPRNEIEEIVESKVSTMPAGLARALDNREDFLDLARFVLEINKGGLKRLNQIKRKAKL